SATPTASATASFGRNNRQWLNPAQKNKARKIHSFGNAAVHSSRKGNPSKAYVITNTNLPRRPKSFINTKIGGRNRRKAYEPRLGATHNVAMVNQANPRRSS